MITNSIFWIEILNNLTKFFSLIIIDNNNLIILSTLLPILLGSLILISLPVILGPFILFSGKKALEGVAKAWPYVVGGTIGINSAAQLYDRITKSSDSSGSNETENKEDKNKDKEDKNKDKEDKNKNENSDSK